MAISAKHHRGNETALEVAESISEVEGEVNGSGLSQCLILSQCLNKTFQRLKPLPACARLQSPGSIRS